jgi:hypothetical protein
MTRSSRDDAGRFICPECGEVLGPQVFDPEQFGEIRVTYIATRYRLLRSLGLTLSALFIGEGYVERARSRWVDVAFDLIVVGGALLAMLIAHALIGFQLHGKRSGVLRLHVGWALMVCAFGINLGTASFVHPGVLQYLFLVALFTGMALLAWDVVDRARRFPIAGDARTPRVLATRSFQVVVGLGVFVMLSAALLHPMMETAWTFVGVMAYVLGLMSLAMLMTARVGLHQAARKWMHPIEVDDSSV